ncbi:ribosome-associated translation inhibitor RaiA [Oscillospiraceae bacterium OttesenSCG-928-F05]|nr:ribosome-associated translation inhibitor RaiA [Oscillospiraceae bacterium OttesenSCG-928-F05]
MTFNFTTKKAHVTDKLREYTEKKIGKFDRYFKNDSEATARFSTEKDRHKVEITIHNGHMYFRASASSSDFFTSVDNACEALVRQMHKNKTRLEKRLRSGAFDSGAAEALPGEDVAEDVAYDIIRTKKFNLKPMTPEEAILQMNMLGHQFFVFKDSDNNSSYSVVYLRNDGGYGLIEAE